MKAGLVSLILLAGTWAGAATAAQVYSWTDANGVKHYSDSPPPSNVDAKKLNVRTGVSSPAPEAQAAQADEQAKAGPKMAAAAGYTPEAIQRNCDTARSNIGIIEQQPPAEDADEATRAQYQDRLDKARQQVQLFCGG